MSRGRPVLDSQTSSWLVRFRRSQVRAYTEHRRCKSVSVQNPNWAATKLTGMAKARVRRDRIRRVELQHRKRINSDGSEVATAAIGPHGELLLLLVPSEERSTVFGVDTQPGWASFPKAKTEAPYGAQIAIHDETHVRTIEITDETRAFPRVALLNNDEILLAGTRCRRFADGTHELNGHVYGPDGRLRREFLLGDGIEHIATDVRGEIWVGYFDEGVFGNYGWGGMTTGDVREDPVGWPGLVRFEADGKMTWRYEPPDGIGTIDDCYALNVGADATWACYYSYFPLVRINPDGSVRGWTTEASGVRAIACDDERAALFGGYKGKRTQCTLARLGAGELTHAESIELVLPQGRPISEDDLGFVFGQGDTLHFFIDDEWMTMSLSDL